MESKTQFLPKTSRGSFQPRDANAPKKVVKQEKDKLSTPFKIPERFLVDDDDEPTQRIEIEEEDRPKKSRRQEILECDEELDSKMLEDVEAEGGEEDSEISEGTAEQDFRECVYDYATTYGVANAKNFFAAEVRRAEKFLGKQPKTKKQKV